MLLLTGLLIGCQFNAKGLGYFAVGAAAGALSAGIGAGVSSAMAGASFGAGFMGSSTALAASSSFISGAAIGGAAGASGGFVTGLGNGLVGGQSLGNSMLQGGLYSVIGGTSGAIVGGLASGIEAGIKGRNFWHGGKVISDVSLPIPDSFQIGEYDCNYYCGESVDGYYGNIRGGYAYFKGLEPGQSGVGLTDVEISRMYARAGYPNIEIVRDMTIPVNTANDITTAMQNGHPVHLSFDTGLSGVTKAGVPVKFAHSTVVSRVRVFDNGRFIINMMNPASSSSSATNTTRFTNLKTIHLLLEILK